MDGWLVTGERYSFHCLVSAVAGHAEVLHRFWDQWPDRHCPDGERDDHPALWQNHLPAGKYTADDTRTCSASSLLPSLSFLLCSGCSLFTVSSTALSAYGRSCRVYDFMLQERAIGIENSAGYCQLPDPVYVNVILMDVMQCFGQLALKGYYKSNDKVNDNVNRTSIWVFCCLCFLSRSGRPLPISPSWTTLLFPTSQPWTLVNPWPNYSGISGKTQRARFELSYSDVEHGWCRTKWSLRSPHHLRDGETVETTLLTVLWSFVKMKTIGHVCIL